MHGNMKCRVGNPGVRRLVTPVEGAWRAEGLFSNFLFGESLGTEGPKLYPDGPNIVKWAWPEKLNIKFANGSLLPMWHGY